MNLRPLGDKVVIKKIEAAEETKSGIVLGKKEEQEQMAEVVAIGSEILNDEKTKDEIKVGDQVVFAQYSGTEVDLEGEKYTVLQLKDILAVVE